MKKKLGMEVTDEDCCPECLEKDKAIDLLESAVDKLVAKVRTLEKKVAMTVPVSLPKDEQDQDFCLEVVRSNKALMVKNREDQQLIKDLQKQLEKARVRNNSCQTRDEPLIKDQTSTH